MIELLKRRNRTLLEMHIGILFCGMVCHAVGALLVKNQIYYAKSLWFGILLAAISAVHMHHSLDRALDLGASAVKLVLRDYMIRYVLIVVILLIIIKTEIMNPLIVFLGYMSLKVTALIQPITHKLCNKLFHETDPVPVSLPEGAAEGSDEEQSSYMSGFSAACSEENEKAAGGADSFAKDRGMLPCGEPDKE